MKKVRTCEGPNLCFIVYPTNM